MDGCTPKTCLSSSNTSPTPDADQDQDGADSDSDSEACSEDRDSRQDSGCESVHPREDPATNADGFDGNGSDDDGELYDDSGESLCIHRKSY